MISIIYEHNNMQNKDLPVGARNNCVGEKIKSDFEIFITFNTNYSNNP